MKVDLQRNWRAPVLCRSGGTPMGQREVEGRPARRSWFRVPIDVYPRCEVLEAERFDERQSSLPVLSLWNGSNA